MKIRAMGVLRGAIAGVAAGGLWWAVEWAANWAMGGAPPARALGTILGLDLAFGAAGGALVGLLTGATSGPVLALGLTAVFGSLRLFEPPGIRSELLYLAVAPVFVALGVRLAGRERRGAIAFVQLTLVGVAATVFGKAAIGNELSDFAATEPNALVLVGLLLGLPLAGVALDRLLGIVVRHETPRLALELAAGAIVLALWGKPFSAVALEVPPPAVPAPRGAPDVVLVSLDTTRADHLSTYGYGRDTSPNLTALARDALNFTQARSPAEWTVPGHASMLTGMYPSRHGAHYAGTWQSGPHIHGRRRVFPLAEDRVTMAELLRDRGYRTGAFVANFGNLYRGFGMAQGFDHYDDAPGVMLKPVPHVVRFVQRFHPEFMKRPFRSAHDIFATGLDWMDRVAPDRPVFLFFNVLEPHDLMVPPPPFGRWARELPESPALARRGLFTQTPSLARTGVITHRIPTRLTPEERAFVNATYDGQIALMDFALGELWAALKARGRYENTVIVVTADHGELLGEHDQLKHGGKMMYEGLLHIPLVVKLAGRDHARGAVHDPVQLVDILPTVLRALGLPVPSGVQGEALPHVTHEIIAEEHINPEFVTSYGAVYDRAIRVLYDRPWKLIATSKGERLLFDLGHDPGEADNMIAREPLRAREMEQRLEAMMSAMDTESAPPRHVAKRAELRP